MLVETGGLGRSGRTVWSHSKEKRSWGEKRHGRQRIERGAKWEGIRRRAMRLEGKVALVTGASSGIGQAIANRFAAEGAHVGVNYLPGGKRAEDAAAIVNGLGTPGLAVAGDVSRREDAERMVGEMVARFGRLDILVNNAG